MKIGVRKMQKNGVRNRLIDILEKIHLYSFAILTMVSVVNIAVVLITKSKMLFFASKYILVYPVLRVTDNVQIKDVILLVFFFSIDLLFIFMTKKEYSDTSPGFHGTFAFASLLWYSFSGFAWQAFNLDTSNPYYGNMIFNQCYYMIFFAVFFFRGHNYAKNSKEFQKTKKKKNKVWFRRHFSHLIFPMIPLLIAVIFGFAVCLVIVLYDKTRFQSVIGIYIVVQIWLIYYSVSNLRNHKKYEKAIINEGRNCVSKKALLISHIMIEIGFLVSFFVILILYLNS